MGDEEYESIKKIVFVAIDPLIRLLLASIEQLSGTNPSTPNEQILAIYKNQIELYQHVQNEIHLWENQVPEGLKFQYKKALNSMQRYYVLPILWTMKNIPFYVTNAIQNERQKMDRLSDDEKYRGNIIIKNAYINTLEVSAKTLKLYLSFLYQQEDIQTDGNLESIGNSSTNFLELEPNLCMNALVVATMAMSNIQHPISQNSDSLNTGESCRQILLALVDELIHSQNTSEVFADLWKSAFQNRSFSESLIISCISTLHKKIDVPEAIHASADIKGNLELKLQSLLTLESLLHRRVDNTTWMIYFPDIFMRLYQEAFQHVRFVRGASSPRLACECIKVMSILMKKTLIVPDVSDNTNKDDLSQTLLSLSIGPTSESGLHISKLSPEIQTFFQRVHTVITKPLVLLLRMSSSNPSKRVREAILYHLCDVTLDDNLPCWSLKLDSQEHLDEISHTHEVIISAFESLILGMNDDNGKFVSYSYFIFLIPSSIPFK